MTLKNKHIRSHPWFDCCWEFGIRREGKIIHYEKHKNNLANLGERNILESFFRNIDNPVQFFIRLAKDVIEETDTLANILNEPVGSGYSPQLIERSGVGFPTIELDSGDFRLTSKEVNFKAVGGDIGPVNVAYLATSSDDTGKLISSVPLSLERIILNGDEGFLALRIKLK